MAVGDPINPNSSEARYARESIDVTNDNDRFSFDAPRSSFNSNVGSEATGTRRSVRASIDRRDLENNPNQIDSVI